MRHVDGSGQIGLGDDLVVETISGLKNDALAHSGPLDGAYSGRNGKETLSFEITFTENPPPREFFKNHDQRLFQHAAVISMPEPDPRRGTLRAGR